MYQTLKHKFLVFVLIVSSFSLQAQKEEIEASKKYISQKKLELGLSSKDILDMRISDAYKSKSTGWYHIYFKQYYQGIEVYNGLINSTLNNGKLVNINHSFASIAELNLVENKNIIAANKIVNKAAKHVNINILEHKTQNNKAKILNEYGLSVEETFIDQSNSVEPIKTKLYWYRYNDNTSGKTKEKIALAWSVKIQTKDKKNKWNVQIDANTGNVINVIDDVIKCDFGNGPHSSHVDHLENIKNSPMALPNNSYNVFAYPLESPNHGSRSIITNPYTSLSPVGTGPGNTNGWHENGTSVYTDTRGNNVWAQDDLDSNNTGGNRPNPANYVFDYPFDVANTPASNLNAAITNLFFWNNLLHDALYNIGFDEAAGNFQTNNLGRGGQGNDHILADAQDGGETNNASFSTSTDGSSPRMEMHIWKQAAIQDTDSDFDNAIISHEYGHGWSTRLTGGPSNSSCLENMEQGGEGWSDYLGLMMTTNWAALSPNVASANIPRGIGTYLRGESTSGRGMRPYKYSYDLNINGAVTYGQLANTSFSYPHGTGSIWCTMLWDMTWEIILQDQAIEPNVYNTVNMRGNVAALKLVNEGLRLQPCSPSFIDARNAILQADQALFNGKYKCAIGRAFSRRGLGLNASTGTSSNDRLVTEDFTIIGSNSLNSITNTLVCSGSPFTNQATSVIPGTSYTWTRKSVNGISNIASQGNSGYINETLTNTTNSPINVVYSISMSPSGCNNVAQAYQNLNVMVNPAAVKPAVSNYTICQTLAVPSGDGLKAGNVLGTKTIDSELSNTSLTFKRNGPTDDFYYKKIKYIPTATKADTFTITKGNFDSYMYLYKNNFHAIDPSLNNLASDDESGAGSLSQIVFNVTKDSVYYVVVTSYDPLIVANFTLSATTHGIFDSETHWYVSKTASTPIHTGSVFNPLLIPNSGLENTYLPGSKKYYTANSATPLCRYESNFIVTEAAVESISSGTIGSPLRLCYQFNQGKAIASNYTGKIIGWEVKTDLASATKFLPAANGDTLYYNGLKENTYVKAILSRNACLVAKSERLDLIVAQPNQNLTNAVFQNNYENLPNQKITSSQKLVTNGRYKLEAERSITLTSGFETTAGVVFSAEIVPNTCPNFESMILRPNYFSSKVNEMTNLYSDSNFMKNKNFEPSDWTQLENSEIKKSESKFDKNKIPSFTLEESLYLNINKQFIDGNRKFNNYLAKNESEILRLSKSW